MQDPQFRSALQQMGLRGCQFTAATVEVPSEPLALSVVDMQMFAVLSLKNNRWNMTPKDPKRTEKEVAEFHQVSRFKRPRSLIIDVCPLSAIPGIALLRRRMVKARASQHVEARFVGHLIPSRSFWVVSPP